MARYQDDQEPYNPPPRPAPAPAPQSNPYAAPRTEAEKQALAQRFHDYDNSDISVAQWREWIDEGRYLGNKQWKSRKIDKSGNPIQGPVDHPDACPQGMIAFGIEQCRSEGEVLGTGGGAAPAAAAAPAPTPGAGAVASGLAGTGDPLIDQLVQMFNTRAGIFGTGNPYLSSASTRTDPAKKIQGTILPGGGLWWGTQNTLLDNLAPSAVSAPVTSSAPAPSPSYSRPRAPAAPAAPAPPDVGVPGNTTGGEERLPYTTPASPLTDALLQYTDGFSAPEERRRGRKDIWENYFY